MLCSSNPVPSDWQSGHWFPGPRQLQFIRRRFQSKSLSLPLYLSLPSPSLWVGNLTWPAVSSWVAGRIAICISRKVSPEALNHRSRLSIDRQWREREREILSHTFVPANINQWGRIRISTRSTGSETLTAGFSPFNNLLSGPTARRRARRFL